MVPDHPDITRGCKRWIWSRRSKSKMVFLLHCCLILSIYFLVRINLFLDAIFFDASPIKQSTPPINEQPASKHKQLGTVSETSSKVGWRTSSVSLLCMTSLEWIFWTGKLPGPVWWLTVCVRHVGKTLLFFGRDGPPRKWWKKVSKH